jgi:hypothetical protein
VAGSIGTQFVEAIAAQNESALAACFKPDVEFRALIPPGLRERVGAEDAAAVVAGWFADLNLGGTVTASEDGVRPIAAGDWRSTFFANCEEQLRLDRDR